MYRLEVDASQLTVMLDRAHMMFGLDQKMLRRLGPLVRDAAEFVRTQATINVGGYPVTFNGGTFRVKVRTGALRGSMEKQWPYGGDPLVARVFVNGAHMAADSSTPGFHKPIPVSRYAGAIEFGHGPIDLKKTMMGKTVPFFASKGFNSQGPYAARGLLELRDGSGFVNPALSSKMEAQGKAQVIFRKQGGKAAYEGGKKGGTFYYIAFRRVGKTGWVIPEAKPRPFMRAAVERTKPRVAQFLAQGAVNVLLHPEAP